MCDLLWSDPQPQNGRAPSKRGVGCQFGPDVTNKFCDENGLDYVVRLVSTLTLTNEYLKKINNNV